MPYIKREVVCAESAENIQACLNCSAPRCSGDCWRIHATDPTAQFVPRKRTPVRCLDTGVVFPSIAAASSFAGRSPATLRAHLHGATRKCGGLRFEYAIT